MEQIQFKTPEDWTQIFIVRGIEKWAFDKPLVLIRKGTERRNSHEMTNKVKYVLEPYNTKEQGRWKTKFLSNGIILPDRFPTYQKVMISAPQTYHSWNYPNEDDFKVFMEICNGLKDSYSLERLHMKAELSQKALGTKVIYNDSPWTMEIHADKNKVVLRPRGWGGNGKDESVYERVENYSLELQKRGLELLTDKEASVQVA